MSGTPPSAPRFLSSDGPIAFAHRGGAIEAPENTLAAFQNAAALGFRYFETDAHVTKDGVVLAFHDPSIDRTTAATGRIADMDWADLRSVRVDGREPIPRLQELFETFPDAFFNIDAKSDAVVDPLLELIAELGVAERVCIGSFDRKRLERVRRAAEGTLCTSASPREVLQAVLHSLVPLVPMPAAPAALQIPKSFFSIPITTKRLVDRAHAVGVHVHVWTIDDPDEMEHLLDIGVDGIMTDRPAALKAVFERRGLWN